FVHRRDAHPDRAARDAADFEETISVAYDHRTLRDESDRRARPREHFETAAGEAIATLDRLIWIRGGPDCDFFARPRRPRDVARGGPLRREIEQERKRRHKASEMAAIRYLFAMMLDAARAVKRPNQRGLVDVVCGFGAGAARPSVFGLASPFFAAPAVAG